MAVGAGDVEGAEDERLAGDEGGGAVKCGLAEDGVLRADAGLFVGHAGLCDFAPEMDAVDIAVERGLDLQPYVHVLDVSVWGLRVRADDERHFAALLEICGAARSNDECDVLAAVGLTAAGFLDGVGEAIGFAGAVEM